MVTSSHVRELLKAHGQCQSQDISEWAGDFPLPDPIVEFYREVGPVDIEIAGVGNQVFIPSLSKLREQQVGYRWDGLTGSRLDDWNDDWFVVADEGGDPFIFCHDEIRTAPHGCGSWSPETIYSDLNTMAACMAIMGSVVLDGGEEMFDDACCILPEFKAKAVSRLTEILSSENEAVKLLELAEWE